MKPLKKPLKAKSKTTQSANLEVLKTWTPKPSISKRYKEGKR